MSDLAESLARRAAERSVADRQATYVREIERIVDATHRVMATTGSFDPPLRDILRESGLSTQAFYKHFRSKDELLLLMLDDGRRRLVSYLEHRMEKAAKAAGMDKAGAAAGRVKAWIEGVLAQAGQAEAAARTRPWLANQDRLAEQFPDEQQASVDLLVALLADAIAEVAPRRPATRDAQVVYHAAFGALHRHLAHGTKASSAEVDHLVRFCLGAIGSGETKGRGRG
jgi:AcrR family transcriptional regulator